MTTEGEMVPGDLPSKGNGHARGGTGGDRVPASPQSSGGRHTQASDVILRRLYAATTAISAFIDDEPRLLQSVAEEFAKLVSAKYAALGILGDDGTLKNFVTFGLTAEEETRLRPNPPTGKGILGALLLEGRALRVDDVMADDQRSGYPPGHPPMHTFLGVPLIASSRVLGRLYATEREGGTFTESDETLAMGFAAAAAVAIESARRTARLLASERLRATGELAIGISHDFNNLLATILGRVEVLLGQVRDVTHRESLEAIRRAARDGAVIAGRMREYGRAVDTADIRPVDLGLLASEAIEFTRPRWQIEEVLAPELPAHPKREIVVIKRFEPAPEVDGDPFSIREALVNLIFNAVDAMPTGGIITIGVQPVDQSSIQLYVSDTGTGIPIEAQPHVFDPFFTTKGARGSGLGLAMVRKVMDGHNGHVEFETDANAGTTFRLYFPAIPVMQRIALQSARLGLGGPVPSKVLSEAKLVTPATIFLIDDQEDVLETITILLRRDGHDVHPFSDPRLAITSLNLRRPDLVITDLSMPHLNGWEVARLARESWEGLPVVLLTGLGRTITTSQLQENGVESVITKPPELDVLRETIERTLQLRNRTPLTIVVVDDATAFATVLRMLLRADGHNVVLAETVSEAITLIRETHRLGLVMLDAHLPDGSASHVLVESRTHVDRPTVCVISGSSVPEARSLVPDADFYMTKVDVPDRLGELIALASRRLDANA